MPCLSLAKSGVRVCGCSPAGDELSTFISLAVITRMSAWICVPSSSTTTLPYTRSVASISTTEPFRTQQQRLGMSFWKHSMMAADCASWRKEMMAVMSTTTYSAAPGQRLVESVWSRP